MKYTLLISLTLILFTASAQKKVVKQRWSPIEKNKNFLFDYDTLGTANNSAFYYNFRTKLYGNVHTLTKVDSKLKKIEKKLKLKYKGLPVTFEKVLIYDDVLYVFSSYLNLKTKYKYLLVQTGDPENLSISNKMRVVTQNKIKGAKSISWEDILIATSPNKKYIVVSTINKSKSSGYEVKLSVYNSKLDNLWNKKVRIRTKGDAHLQKTLITNEAEILILAKRQINEKFKEANKKYEFLLQQIGEEDKKPFEYQIGQEEKSVNDLRIIALEDGTYKGLGFYSEKSSLATNGIVAMDIDADNREIGSLKFTEFSIDFVTQGLINKDANKLEKKERKNKEVEIEHLDLKQVKKLPNGEYLLVGEPNATSSTEEKTYYYSGPINLIAINENNEIAWNTKILKAQQVTQTHRNSNSFYMHERKNKLYFFFNDHAENYKDKKNSSSGNKKRATYIGYDKKSVTVCAILDLEEMQISTHVISKNATKEVNIIPGSFTVTEKGELIFAAYRIKKVRFGKFSFMEKKKKNKK